MTKKDYILIANVLNETMKRDTNDYLTIIHIARGLSVELLKDNPLFDKKKFMIACGIKYPSLEVEEV